MTPVEKSILFLVIGIVILAILYILIKIMMREDDYLHQARDIQKKTIEQLEDAYKKTEEKLKRVKDLTDRLRYIRSNKKERY